MRKPHLIGLTGYAGSGKDTVREILERKHGFDGIAFADPIRDMLRELLDTVGVGHEWMDSRELKEAEIPQLGVSYRQMAQTLGTEWGRALSTSFWLKIAETKVSLCEQYGSPGVVISDVRFPNEAEWIKANGGSIWRILRPGVAPVRPHDSERLIELLPYDYVIDNVGALEDLAAATAAALRHCGGRN